MRTKAMNSKQLQARISEILDEIGVLELKLEPKKAVSARDTLQPTSPVVLVDAETGVTKLG